MEQALLDKLKNGTADDIDLEMIAARCKVAGKALDEVCHEFCDRIEKLYDEYEAEYKLLHSTVVMFYKDRLFEVNNPNNNFEIAIISGYGKYIEEIRDSLMEEETRK